MKNLLLGFLGLTVIALPALAALDAGDTAPNFEAKASLAGKAFDFSLRDALDEGLVVGNYTPACLEQLDQKVGDFRVLRCAGHRGDAEKRREQAGTQYHSGAVQVHGILRAILVTHDRPGSIPPEGRPGSEREAKTPMLGYSIKYSSDGDFVVTDALAKRGAVRCCRAWRLGARDDFYGADGAGL